ncbi:MAG: hypothetical protein EGP89_00210 [Ruminococcaceae bacterium]|nr:hypothetical protein [Oscillospiraceae bacterium]
MAKNESFERQTFISAFDFLYLYAFPLKFMKYYNTKNSFLQAFFSILAHLTKLRRVTRIFC